MKKSPRAPTTQRAVRHVPNSKSPAAEAGASILPKSPAKLTVPTADDLPEDSYARDTMLEARGCCVPPPNPPIIVIEISDHKPGITAIPIKPIETQAFPPSNIQNSPICSAKNPAGI